MSLWDWLGVILIALLVVLLLLLILVLRSTITIQMKARKSNQDEVIKIEAIMLLGIVHFHYTIPRMSLSNLGQGLQVENDHADNLFSGHTNSERQHINKEKIDQWSEQAKQILRSTEGLLPWLKALLKKISFQQFDWSTNIALQDAAVTATLTGVLWAVKSTLVGWLSQYITLKQQPRLFVVPVFDSTPIFTTEFSCIAKIRCGHAIHAGLVLIVRVLKVKGGVRKWLNILFKGS